jgi:hypothetical protein
VNVAKTPFVAPSCPRLPRPPARPAPTVTASWRQVFLPHPCRTSTRANTFSLEPFSFGAPRRVEDLSEVVNVGAADLTLINPRGERQPSSLLPCTSCHCS